MLGGASSRFPAACQERLVSHNAHTKINWSGDEEACKGIGCSGGLQRKVEALATAARLRQGAPGIASDIPGLQETSLREMYSVLSQQAKGIATLQAVLQREARHLSILETSVVKAK